MILLHPFTVKIYNYMIFIHILTIFCLVLKSLKGSGSPSISPQSPRYIRLSGHALFRKNLSENVTTRCHFGQSIVVCFYNKLINNNNYFMAHNLLKS